MVFSMILEKVNFTKTFWKNELPLFSNLNFKYDLLKMLVYLLCSGDFHDVSYHEMGIGRAGVMQQSLVGFLYNVFNQWFDGKRWSNCAMKTIRYLIAKFTPTASMNADGQQYFGGDWCSILPMDQEMWDELMPIQFTELWFDLEDADVVMNFLKNYWEKDNGFNNTGSFSWELYPAKAGGYDRMWFAIHSLMTSSR